MHYKHYSLVSIVSYVNAVNVISDFLNIYQESKNNSFYYFDFNKTIAQYEKYLLDNGYKAYTNVNNILSETMEYKTYKTPTLYYRLLSNVMKFIQKTYEPTKKNVDLLELDVWDARKLPFRVNSISLSRPRYTISFKRIKQKGINILAKKYVLQRLKTKQLSTCLDDLKGINMFSIYLFEHYNQINTLDQLDRETIEDYLSFVNLNDNLKPRTKSKRIGVLKTFFESCMINGWKGSPDKSLIISQDVKKKYNTLPKYYEDGVLLQINKHLEDLPIQIARMCYVIQNVGMRISELCILETNCLKKDSEGDGVLVYYQKKTKSYNRIPVKEDIVATINEAINYTKDTYGEKSKYVFMKDDKTPITVDMFSYHMNRLMKKNNILDSDGKIVRIKSHHFRSTVATKYANKGMKPNMIRTML